MNKLIKSAAFLMVSIIFISLLVIPASAHSGRTDSQGGHRDNQNKSGLGPYHYHHGYPAHLHENGICPYAAKDTISISNQPSSISIGDTVTLEWTVTYYSGNSSVIWSSSDPSVIDATGGTLTAKAPGTATITAQLYNGVKTFKVTAKEIKATELAVSNIPERLEVSNSATLEATVLPENTTYKTVTWSSSDDTIATVSDAGTVSAIGEGIAKITASTVNGISHTYEIEVYEVRPENIQISADSLKMLIDTSDKLSAKVMPADTSDQSITWSSSNTAVATVDNQGEISAKGIGSAVITASCQDVSADVPVEVYYIKMDSIGFENLNNRIKLEQTVTPTITFSPDDATYPTVTLTSSDESVIRVDGVQLVAVGKGTAVITAASHDTSINFEVEVYDNGGLEALGGFVVVVGVISFWLFRRKKKAQ